MVIRIPHKIKKFVFDRYILVTFILGFCLWLVAFGITYVYFFPSENNLILHTNFRGEADIVGSSADVMWIVIVFMFLFLINQLLSFSLYYRERVLSYILNFANVFLMFMSFLIVYYLSSIN